VVSGAFDVVSGASVVVSGASPDGLGASVVVSGASAVVSGASPNGAPLKKVLGGKSKIASGEHAIAYRLKLGDELFGVLIVRHCDCEIDVAREPWLGAHRNGEPTDQSEAAVELV